VLQIDDLQYRVGNFRLQDISLQVRPREYFVLMGQTGSGKTLLLKCICGLLRVAAGRILIDGREVTNQEPRHRRVGYVPQEGGLFPHMDVARNIAFALRVRGMSHAPALREAQVLVDMLGLGSLLKRRTMSLSGGERQKVALARALAARPSLLVLDEPVSALDEPTRRDVCAELLRVQRELNVSTVHVCHNLEEARSLCDRVGILDAGRLVQVGRLEDLQAAPATSTVARILNVPWPAEQPSAPGGQPAALPAAPARRGAHSQENRTT